ncbi:FlhC family transcriptional regulator [Acidithiobacillus caldus]|nr:FlhC family transcriptional regulator [Acidithiobacillus caldus]
MSDKPYSRDMPFASKSATDKRLRNLQLAHLLIEGGVRPINAHYCTRINKRYLGQLWLDIHGYPARGQTPLFSHVYVKTRKTVRQGTIFVMLLRQYEQTFADLKEPGVFLFVYERYKYAMADSESCLSMEVAFYLWRDYLNKTVWIRSCTQCKAGYLYSSSPDAAQSMRTCQFCRLVKASKNRKKPDGTIITQATITE